MWFIVSVPLRAEVHTFLKLLKTFAGSSFLVWDQKTYNIHFDNFPLVTLCVYQSSCRHGTTQRKEMSRCLSWWFCSSVKALRKVNVRKCRPTLRSCALKTTCRIMVYFLWKGIHRMNKCSNLPGDIFEVSYHLYCMQKVTHCGVWDLFFFVILNISGANLILFKSFWPRLCI